MVNLFFKDFSLSRWLLNQNIAVGQQLPDYAVDLLTEQLGIAQYLQNKQCSKQNMYPINAGWNTLGNNVSVKA